MALSRSGQLYRERKGRIRTSRGPVPLAVTNIDPVHTYPVPAPLPYPQFTTDTNGAPPADGGLTTLWPHEDD